MNQNTQEIIKGLENSQKAKPSEDFLSSMEVVLSNYTTKVNYIITKKILSVAASLLFLVAINIGLLIGHINNNNVSDVQSISEHTYNLIPTKSLYNE